MRKTRKMKFALVLTCMVLSAAAFGACDLLATGNSSSVQSGELAYELTDKGYMVSGIGSCKDKDVQVPSTYNGEPVVGVRYDAFDYYDKMTSIVLPDSVTVIGENAFAYCEKLQSVTFGSGLQEIETTAFIGCTALEEVSFGANLESVGSQAFEECSALTNVTFDATNAKILAKAFAYCTALKSLDLTGVTEINEAAFQGCVALEGVDLKTVKTLQGKAFVDCVGLQTADLGTALTFIGDRAFGACLKLQSVVVPATVNTLTNAQFSGSSKLQAIYFRGSLAECEFKNNFTDIPMYAYAENDPFENGATNYDDLFWHTVNGSVVHWNERAGSSCAIVYSQDTGAYTFSAKGTVTELKFNDASNAGVSNSAGLISVDKALLYANPGMNTVTWRNENDTLYVYTLKSVPGGVLDFETFGDGFVRGTIDAAAKGVTNATAATGNGAKSLKMEGKGSTYIGIDTDFVNALFADPYVTAMQFKVYTKYDLRQKLAWYYQNFKMVDGESVMVGNQVTSGISYEDKGDYLLITVPRSTYETWVTRNVYMDTDVMQFLFRFARDLQAGESPTPNGQDTLTQYKWVSAGTFYLDDVQGVK